MGLIGPSRRRIQVNPKQKPAEAPPARQEPARERTAPPQKEREKVPAGV